MKKRALHLLNSLKPGGAENVALNYAGVLNKLGIQSVFVGEPASETYADYLRKHGEILGEATLSDMNGADFIFVHSNINLFRVLACRLRSFRFKPRVVYVQHLNYSKSKFFFLSKIINLVCSDFIQISPITDDIVGKYIRIRKHFIVNFYINKYTEVQYPDIRSAIRSELNIPPGQELITFSGVFKPGKNLEDFLKLAKENLADPSRFFLLIGDGQEAYKIKDYALSNLKWIGFVNDVEKYLIASDVYFFPSLFKLEMLPMALIEAINTNKKILAYDTRINAFLLNGSVCGSLEEAQSMLAEDRFPAGLTRYDFEYAIQSFGRLVDH